MRSAKHQLNRLNAVVGLFLAYVLVLMLGYLAMRYRLRANLSGAAFFPLSEKTLGLLGTLDRPVRVTVLFQDEHGLYSYMENLLEEYRYHSRNILVEWVDPVRDRAKTEFLASRYGLTEVQVVILDDGERFRVVPASLMMDMEAVPGSDEIRMAGFRGELAISSALLELKQSIRPKVYFLAGHGEQALGRFDRIRGYSSLEKILRGDAIDAADFVLTGQQPIPADADAVVVAGPTKQLSSIAVEVLEDYLHRSGRLLILLDAQHDGGLRSMLSRWGVGLRNDVVVDPENTLRGRDVHVRRFSEHPICADLKAAVQLMLPRSVFIYRWFNTGPEGADRPQVVPLLFSSQKSWSEVEIDAARDVYDEAAGDILGPFPMGVAVERGAVHDLDVQIEPSRLVVIGDSDFVSNGNLVAGNADFFMNALNWLLDREELMAIAPKPIIEVRLSISRRMLQLMFWLMVAGIPLLPAVAGVAVWIRRRR